MSEWDEVMGGEEDEWSAFISHLEKSIEKTEQWVEENLEGDQAIAAVPMSEYKKVVENNIYLQKQLLTVVKIFTQE